MENSIEYDGSSKLVYKSQNHEYKTVYGGVLWMGEEPLNMSVLKAILPRKA